MNNVEKAANVINSALPAGCHITETFGERAAQALADAGLLMPDLPQPDLCADDPNHQRRFAEEWGDDQPTPDVWFLPGGVTVQTLPGYKEIQLNRMGEAEEPITLAQARTLALVLLAAAQWAEKEKQG